MIKLLVWIGLAIVIGLYIRPKWIYGFLAIGGVIEALIGFGQFLQQKSLGLQFFGEPVLSPLNPDVARIFIDTGGWLASRGLGEGWGRLLRAYGTFPHPNILAAFLVLAIISFNYLSTKLIRRSSNKFSSGGLFFGTAGIFILWLGLILTFSRAGWLAALIITLFYLIDRCPTVVRWRLAAIVIITVIGLVVIFHWAVLPRLAFTDSFVIQERISDYQRAWQLIKEKPFFGHGLTLAMAERPIHNLYLTIAVEIGLFGLAVFLVFVIFTLIENWKLPARHRSEPQALAGGKIGNSPAAIMLVALLLLGLFDHFLWTLRPGLAMLWLVIGLLWQSDRSRSSMDRISPSEGGDAGSIPAESTNKNTDV